jgi:NAD(P)-dependent dehydrogenase (short-subunit alcohol dehydrogenase family)
MTGKTVFITGAARGIGAESARRLAASGANVALVGLEPDELERLANQIGHDRALALQCDITDRDALDEAVARTVERFGGIDALFANAGIGSGGLIRSVDPEAFERVLEVNVFGTWRTVRACLPQILERKGYVLINASVAPIYNVFPVLASYGMSKSAAESFGNSLRLELKHHGVDVGVAYFSWIATELVKGADAEVPAFRRLREEMQGPPGKTYPVAVAGRAVERGMRKRKRIVVGPWWVRGLLPLRGLLTRVTESQMRKLMPELEAMTEAEQRERGAAASTPVGAGGRAAARAGEKVS